MTFVEVVSKISNTNDYADYLRRLRRLRRHRLLAANITHITSSDRIKNIRSLVENRLVNPLSLRLARQLLPAFIVH
jgi:hypothetical protein